MAQTSIITGQYVEIRQNAATVLQRGIAWMIDFLIMFIASLTLSSPLTLYGFAIGEDMLILFIFLWLLAILCYPLYMEIFNHGQSFGKMVMGIRVMCLDGSTPTNIAYLLRWILMPVDFGISGLGLAFIIFTKNCQRIGDLAAGTTVVKLSKSEPPLIIRTIPTINKNYQPTYPEVTRLDIRQMGVIEQVLLMKDGPQKTRNLTSLAEKVDSVLGIKHQENDNEAFLLNVYNDFQYYAIHGS
jgi:uncharacterized RDD family membrane protein YckC